jgi:predicted aspartyl protease
MRFRYKLIPSKQPVIALGGRWVRPRPLIMVALLTPAGVIVREALLDNGADDTVFPESAAHKLGLDLAHAPAVEAMAVGGQVFPVRYAQVTIRMVQGREQREWPAWVRSRASGECLVSGNVKQHDAGRRRRSTPFKPYDPNWSPPCGRPLLPTLSRALCTPLR